MLGRTALAILACLGAAAAGCEEADFPDAEAPRPVPIGECFRPDRVGAVRGRVHWEGPLPLPETFRAPVAPSGPALVGPRQTWPNPHAPAIGPDGGVGGVVVRLRGVEPARSRPWDHAPVRVEVRDQRLIVVQGAEGTVGFVRRGDAVEVVSRQAAFHSVQGRGAACFAAALADPDLPTRRRLDADGLVELSSSSGQFWTRAYLFVADHPYLTRTAADGAFALEGVPPGDYEAVCWLPDWHVAEREYDADTGLTSRLGFAPPVERRASVHVEAGGTAAVTFTPRAEWFGH